MHGFVVARPTTAKPVAADPPQGSGRYRPAAAPVRRAALVSIVSVSIVAVSIVAVSIVAVGPGRRVRAFAEAGAGEVARVIYQPPVPGAVVDNWRPPEHPYGAGNLGVDFAAEPGESVLAAADGVITFAGPVGGSLFVVIAHADGLRTTVGFLRSVSVRRGARVTRGSLVAIAAGPVHFGVRRGSTYLDPRTLFARRVWLVR